ncbi:MAG: methyltransferase RsmF C-terminal domain-like protein, partial [Flavobacteriales bacterium]
RYTLDPKLHAGCYYPQETSSMILQWVLKHCGLGEGSVDALDVCAAPGGNSLILSDFLAGRGRLVSNEIIRSRAHILQEVMVKWGSPNVVVTNNRPSDFGKGAMQFDLLLIDAPCSGEGMFRKDPEARSEWTSQSPVSCSVRQREILNDVLPALREGGVLIYSTCTFAPEENEEIIESIMESGEYESIHLPVPPDWNIDVIEEQGVFAMRFLPHRVAGEGLFIAAVRKKVKQNSIRSKPKSVFKSLSKDELKVLANEGCAPNGLLLGPDNEVYRSVFSIEELNMLAGNLYLLQPGIHMGRLVRNDFNPGHAYALAQDEVFQSVPVELDEPTALAYLRGESVIISAPNGWQRVAYGGAVLGWVKVIGNRTNNYYPKEWRVKIKE